MHASPDSSGRGNQCCYLLLLSTPGCLDGPHVFTEVLVSERQAGDEQREPALSVLPEFEREEGKELRAAAVSVICQGDRVQSHREF